MSAASDKVLARTVVKDCGFETPCWCWQGGVGDGGYGQVSIVVDGVRRLKRTHRVAYEGIVGPIEDGLTLDHLCEVKTCVNPDHLEPVTSAENISRHYARHPVGPVCPNGHQREGNTYVAPSGHRQCKPCNQAAVVRYQIRKKALHARSVTL